MLSKYEIYDEDYNIDELRKINDDDLAGLDKASQEQKVEATLAELSDRLNIQRDEQEKNNANFLKVQEECRIFSSSEASRETGEV